MASSSSNFLSPLAVLRFFLTMLVGLSLDLWTKTLAVDRLKDGSVIDVVPGWLRLEYTENPGAVFGIAPGQRWVFLLISVAALVFLTFLFATSGRRAFYQIILGMLLAGVLGNMYDRVRYGYVRDMIHALPMWPRFFPWIFNIADSLLCVGVGLMLIYSIFHTPASTGEISTEPADA